LKITSCRFECAAFREQDEPRESKPQVVFLGRSNVGKSSLINRLLGVRGLAKTSSRPGRTQSVNFYGVNEAIRFVDLPGYGYARVPLAVRQSWGAMIEGFLERWQAATALAVLVVDARHAPSELDLVMGRWIVARGVPGVVAATKSDKLSGNGRAGARRTIGEALCGAALEGPVLVSAESGVGVRELWSTIDRALGRVSKRSGARR